MGKSEIGIVEESFCFHWKIPDFFLLEKNQKFKSPLFSALQCTWHLELRIGNESPEGTSDDELNSDYENTDEENEDADIEERVMLKLFIEDFGFFTNKAVVYTLGKKKNDGMLEEKFSKFQNFTKDKKCGSIITWNLNGLRKQKDELALYDAITFTCRIEQEHRGLAEVVPQLMALVELEALSDNFKDLLTSNKKCDVTIKVKDREFQAHKSVLVARCSVFSAMFEHGMEDEKNGIVDVPDCDPDSFGILLHYLYSGKIEDVSFRNAHHLYISADKYNLQVLKSFCSAYMIRNLTMDNILDVVSLAEQFDDTTIMSSAQNFFNHNVVEIISKSEWERMMKDNYRLANKLLKEMTTKVNIS